MDMCKTCKTNPVKCKKTQECGRCYGQRRYGEEKDRTRAWREGMGIKEAKWDKQGFRSAYEREIQFAAAFFGKRPFLYEPATFDLQGEYFADGHRRRYTPDYYDIERDTWIEVVGSRQAQSASQHIYKAFRQTFPNLKFEIRSYKCDVYPDDPIVEEEVGISQESQSTIDLLHMWRAKTTDDVQKLPDSR